MVQTLTVFSNGIAEINTGTNFLVCNNALLTQALQEKLDEIESVISAAGISQLHVEKDIFKSFEHAVTASGVTANDFGTTVSSGDFDWIIQNADIEISARKAAEQEAAEIASQSFPEIITSSTATI
jgi:hypothetical protein